MINEESKESDISKVEEERSILGRDHGVLHSRIEGNLPAKKQLGLFDRLLKLRDWPRQHGD